MNRAENTVVGIPELGVTVSPDAVVELDLVKPALELVEPALDPQPARAAIATAVTASLAVRFIAAPR
jgi:hypothetical protein